MKHFVLLVLASFTVGLAPAPSAAPQIRNATTQSITANGLESSPGDFETALAAASAVYGKAGCPVILARHRVGAATLPRTSLDPWNYELMSGTRGYMSGVASITYCAGKIGTYAGCSTGSKFFVVLDGAEFDGTNVAHEYSHTRGNSHTQEAGHLMLERAGVGDFKLTSAECDTISQRHVPDAETTGPRAPQEPRRSSGDPSSKSRGTNQR